MMQNRCLAVALLLFVVAPCVNSDEPKSEPAPDAGTLTWNNDDRLSGQLAGFHDGYIRWQSEQFSEPLEVHSDFIASVEFQQPDQTKSDVVAEPFRVESADGDIFLGDLLSIDDNVVQLQSQRLGKVDIDRSYVREIRQIKHTQVLYDGPRWLDGWHPLRAGRLVSEWKATEHGHLHTNKYNGELYHDLPKLDLAEIHLVLRWKGKPGLQIDFAPASELLSPGTRPRLSIKSWGDDVVATTSMGGTDFQPLLKLNERQTELRLRIVWDNKAGEAVISGPGGKVYGRVIVDKSRKGFGVLIKNRSDDLTIEQVRLSKWNGASKSEDREEGKGYVRLGDGRLVNDNDDAMEYCKLLLESSDPLSLSDVAIIEFIPDVKTDFQKHHVRFFDGTEFAGKLVSIDDDHLTIKSPAVKEQVRSKLAGLDSIHCFQGRTNEFEFHLNGDGNRLSGNLRAVPGTNALGWAPIGCKVALPIIVGTEQTIERRMGRSATARPLGSEVVMLRDGSVLFGTVQRIEDKSLILDTDYTDEQAIPISKVRATEMLNGSGRVSFNDRGWEFMREARPLQRAQERLEISDPISMRHNSLEHGGRVSFSCTWDEDFTGLLSVHMGVSTKQPRTSLVRFTFSQNRVTARSLINAATSQSLPVFSERRANIAMDINGRRLVVWVNGIKVFETSTKKQIDPQGLWIQGGSARNMLGRGSNNPQNKPRLMIDRLRIGDGAGRIGAGFAAQQSLDMVLKLPRNRVSDAPECVLCATNGDLLRGKLVSLTRETVSFKSRYEEVEMPRDEVSALVWLSDAEAASDQRPSAKSVSITLRDGSHLLIQQPSIQDDSLVGKHDLLTECKVPLDQILKLENGPESTSMTSSLNWKLEKTPAPKFVDDGAGEGLDSLLIGQNVSEITIPMLDDTTLRIGDQQQIVVLDFWASWCAPCIRSLPRLVNLMKTYPAGKVRFIAVNEEENEFAIQGFLSNRGLEMEVGMDADGALAKKFGVTTIPQTIIIGPNGKVERHFVGAPTDLHQSISESITNLLEPTD